MNIITFFSSIQVMAVYLRNLVLLLTKLLMQHLMNGWPRPRAFLCLSRSLSPKSLKIKVITHRCAEGKEWRKRESAAPYEKRGAAELNDVMNRLRKWVASFGWDSLLLYVAVSFSAFWQGRWNMNRKWCSPNAASQFASLIKMNVALPPSWKFQQSVAFSYNQAKFEWS